MSLARVRQDERVVLLESHYAMDSGTTEAASLYLEVDGRGVDIVLREAIPVGSDRTTSMRLALARVCALLGRYAREGE